MNRPFWSKLVFALTFLGALLTFASWLGQLGQGILLVLIAGLVLQAFPVFLISMIARSRTRRRVLESLAMSGGRVTERLASAPHCILALDLTEACLETVEWESLFSLVNLESLILSGTAFTDDRLEHLARLPALRFLNLDDTLVTDAGLFILRNFSALETVSFTNTPVTEDGIEHLLRSRSELQVIAGHIFGSTDLHSLQDVCHDSVL